MMETNLPASNQGANSKPPAASANKRSWRVPPRPTLNAELTGNTEQSRPSPSTQRNPQPPVASSPAGRSGPAPAGSSHHRFAPPLHQIDTSNASQAASGHLPNMNSTSAGAHVQMGPQQPWDWQMFSSLPLHPAVLASLPTNPPSNPGELPPHVLAQLAATFGYPLPVHSNGHASTHPMA
ncbi:hypothetical protein BS47DRAFT_1386027, partial [Hydnum rufescens UP504]